MKPIYKKKNTKSEKYKKKKNRKKVSPIVPSLPPPHLWSGLVAERIDIRYQVIGDIHLLWAKSGSIYIRGSKNVSRPN